VKASLRVLRIKKRRKRRRRRKRTKHENVNIWAIIVAMQVM
jgi:hypothetical protein